jgi:hypothetical protein
MSSRQQAQESYGQSPSRVSESSTRSQPLVAVLPDLRRYARAVSGSLESGDRYLRQFLEVVLAAPDVLAAGGDTKLQCFTLFHQVCRGLDPSGDTLPAASASWMERRLASLPSVPREVLLLVYLEGFPISHAAQIVGLSEPETRDHLLEARSTIKSARRDARLERQHSEPVASLLTAASLMTMEAAPLRQHVALLD